MSPTEIGLWIAAITLICTFIIAANNFLGLKDRFLGQKANNAVETSTESSQKPELRLVHEFVHRRSRAGKVSVKVAIGVRNEGDATARTPHVSIRIPRYVSWDRYGLDGNYNEGMPRLPQAGAAMERQYGGDRSISIHPDGQRMITAIGLEFNQANPNVQDVELRYSTSSEDSAASERQHTIRATEIREFLGLENE